MATVTTQERTNILKLVAGMFNAAPGATYLNEFTNAFVDLNKDLGALANALGQTGAFQSLYPSFLTADEFANKFLDTLGLKANTEAQDWVKAKVNAGESFASVIFQALVAIDASTSDDFKAAKDQLANKAAVAEYYSVTLQASSDDLATLQNVVAKVTDDPKSVEAANDANQGGSGKTFTLTTGIDNLQGTSGNDTFLADGNTSSAADQIDGGAGVDTFKLYIAADAKVEDTILPTLKNVENVYIKGGEVTNAKTVDVSSLAGVQSFELDSTKLDASATIKTTAAQEVKLSNVTGAAGGTVVTLDGAAKATVSGVKNGATPATDTVTLDVKSATATGFALAATGAASAVTLTNTGAKLTSLTISGDKAVTVSEAIASIKTVDASANTAGVTLKYTGAANDLTVKGGAGNDRFEIANFNDKVVVDGGAGKDTLSIALADAAAFTKAAAVTNVEVLAVTGDTAANTTLNADYFGVNSFEIVGKIGHNVTLTNLANNGTVQLDADSVDVATLTVDVKGAIAGTNDVLNLTTDKDGADLATKAVTVLANGVEVVNIASSSETGAGAFKLGTLTSAQLKTITITGVGDVSVDTVSAAALSSIDASAAKGAVSISAKESTAAVTFKGGEGVDTYTASNKGDTIFGSKGADQITLGTGADKLVYTAAEQSNAAAKDVVANFDVNADLIQFAASLQTGTAVYTGTTAFSATAGKTQIGFTDDDNPSDLQVDFDGNGTVDFVVELTGVTAADFGAANFVFA